MNINTEGYTREQIITALFSSARKVRYEYVVIKSTGEYLGMLEIQDGVISYDSTSEIMRTFKGSVKENNLLDFEDLDFQIIPYLCLMMFNQKEAKFPLGRFLINVSRQSNNNINMLTIEGYDFGKVALDDKNDNRFYADDTFKYTQIIDALINDIYTNAEITPNDNIKSFSQDWEIGSSKLEIINDLLKGINYNPLHFDENGKALCIPREELSDREIDFQYSANNTSIIVDGINLVSDRFDIPNKWIRYTENPELPMLMSVLVNDNENSPYSTVNRGRVIVDSASVDDIANQAELDRYTRRESEKSMEATYTLNFSTLNMPGHGYREVLWIDIPQYNISGRFVETGWEMELKTGGMMKHVCKKVVNIWD